MQPIGRNRIPLFFSHPLRLFSLVLTIVFVAEAVVMLSLSLLLPRAGYITTSLADAVMLSILVAPFLWWLVVRPLRSAAMRERAYAAAIFANAVDGIITINQHGLVESFNPAAERIFRYTPSDIVGQNISLLFPQQELGQDRDAEHLRSFLAGRSKAFGAPSEVIGHRKNGATFPLDLAVVEMHTEEDRMFVVIMRDISERKLAE